MKENLISILLLTWNAKEITADCIESIKKQTYKNYELIVIDNASKDGTPEYLKKRFPFIKLVLNKENVGYAGGHNEGFKKAKGKYLLILNNDVVLDKNFLKELWKNKDKADILGIKNYYFDKKNTFWAIGSRVNKYTMKATLIGNKEEDGGQYDLSEIDQAVGSAMLVNRKVIETVGFLDASFFAYYEETEWQTRAIEKEFTISWVPTAKLWHKVAYSYGGNKNPIQAYYLVRNRAYYIQRWSEYKFIAYFSWIAEVLIRILYGFLKNKTYSKMTFLGARDFFKGIKGKINEDHL